MQTSPEDTEDDISTLVLVTIAFRHGDRTPDVQNTYPTNPYKNKSFHPYKLGEVTHKGQTRMYNIGKNLRARYDDFLGKEFFTDLICATSCNYTRCQMSLQALLAGLFPPTHEDAIPELKWQAIPYNIIPFEQDKFISIHKHCPMVMDLAYDDKIDPDDRHAMAYLERFTGYIPFSYLHCLRVYDSIKTCVEAGLDVPEWAQPLWPDTLEALAHKYWNFFQRKRKRFGAGSLIKRITEEVQAKVNGNYESAKRKLYLYAVHDMNLQLLRGALNVWDDEHVNYGAHIIFEIHKIDGIYGFKIYYQNSYPKPKLLTVPGCNDFIPLGKFIEITRDLYTPEETCEEIELPKGCVL